LYAIAVMHVPVDDKDAFDVVHFQRVLRSHGDVIEKAKSVGLVSLCMVTRRPDNSQTFLGFVLESNLGQVLEKVFLLN
jgi:hypothetical protein